MIEARVRVVRAQPGRAWVTATEAGGCAACHSQSTCGLSGLGRYFARRAPLLSIAQDQARPGQELVLRIAEADLLKAGLLAYLLPALLAVFAAALADAAALGDGLTALAALGGLGIGLLLARLGEAAPLHSSLSGASNE